MTTTRVYSYRRFSSGRQAHGHSLERQTASARAWCVEHGYELDEEFELSDMATSAYTGKNATDGALAAFLLAAKGGKVPSGSILLVESLDRLSRNHLTEAIALLTSIVQAGIRVVSLLDGKEWNRENINDTMNFMLSVLLFARAHEESATKAKRVRAAFAKSGTLAWRLFRMGMDRDGRIHERTGKAGSWTKRRRSPCEKSLSMWPVGWEA